MNNRIKKRNSINERFISLLFIFKISMSTRIYLVNRATAKRYRLNGIHPTEQLPLEPDLKKLFSDYQTSKASILPATVDLRPYMTPVENQSKTACW